MYVCVHVCVHVRVCVRVCASRARRGGRGGEGVATHRGRRQTRQLDLILGLDLRDGREFRWGGARERGAEGHACARASRRGTRVRLRRDRGAQGARGVRVWRRTVGGGRMPCAACCTSCCCCVRACVHVSRDQGAGRAIGGQGRRDRGAQGARGARVWRRTLGGGRMPCAACCTSCCCCVRACVRACEARPRRGAGNRGARAWDAPWAAANAMLAPAAVARRSAAARRGRKARTR